MKKSWITWLGLGAACAVCCAPLIAPLLAGAAGIGAAGIGVTFFRVGLVEALCVAAIVAALVALGVLVLVRYRAARKAVEACACALPGDAVQCEVDGVCAPGERGSPP